MVVELEALHLSAEHMDGRSWLLFSLILAPALLLFVWTAVKVQRDHEDVTDALPRPLPDDWRTWDRSL